MQTVLSTQKFDQKFDQNFSTSCVFHWRMSWRIVSVSSPDHTKFFLVDRKFLQLYTCTYDEFYVKYSSNVTVNFLPTPSLDSTHTLYWIRVENTQPWMTEDTGHCRLYTCWPWNTFKFISTTNVTICQTTHWHSLVTPDTLTSEEVIRCETKHVELITITSVATSYKPNECHVQFVHQIVSRH